jgi:hypothetical protein
MSVDTPTPSVTEASLGQRALWFARSEIGVVEVPLGSNRGPRVDVYQRGVHNDGADYLIGTKWCARFVRWCFESAAAESGQLRLFAGCGDLASALKWLREAQQRGWWRQAPAPGFAALHIGNNSEGHVTLVSAFDGQFVDSVGGNEADGVRPVRRLLSYYNKGFVEVER